MLPEVPRNIDAVEFDGRRRCVRLSYFLQGSLGEAGLTSILSRVPKP